MAQIMDVFGLLILTYSRYADGSSQDAVEAVGLELVRRDELRGTAAGTEDEVKFGVAEQMIGWLANEKGYCSCGADCKFLSVLNFSLS